MILYIFTILHDYYSCNQSVTAVVTVPGEKEKKKSVKKSKDHLLFHSQNLENALFFFFNGIFPFILITSVPLCVL